MSDMSPTLGGVALADLHDLLAAPADAARSLPPEMYRSAFYEVERERILAREWFCVARIDQFESAGAQLAVQVLDVPMVLTLVDDKVRALSRLCAHRGMDLGVSQDSNFLTCPYHLWKYDLCGALVGAPEMRGVADFDKSDVALRSFPVEVWQGFVFVSLADDPKPLTPRLSGLDRHLGHLRLDTWRTVWSDHFGLAPANWKLVVENAVENYHHIGVHPASIEPDAPGRLSWTEDAGDDVCLILRNAPAPGRGGRRALFDLPDWFERRYDDPFVVYAVFPTLLFSVDADGTLFWFEAMPTAHDAVDIRLHLLVPPEIADQPDSAIGIESVAAAIQAIAQEDAQIYKPLQQAMESSAAARGRLSLLESGVRRFGRYVARQVLEAAE